MAHYTKHPVTAPPTAPEREATGHLMLRGYIILVLVVTFAHAAVYDLVGEIGAAVVLAVFLLSTLAIGIPMLAKSRPQRFAWRRLPWSALGYTSLAIVSVAWSQWRGPTVITWVLLATVTVNALFIAHVLTWHEIIRALASAFKWVLGLSLAVELWVSLVVRGNLFGGEPVHGIVGNSNLIAIISLLALLTFGVLYAARTRWRASLILWALLAVFFLVRAGSATAYASAAATALVLTAVLLMRRAPTPGARSKLYVLFIGGGAVIAAVAWFFREPLLTLLGRDDDLTGSAEALWGAVLERVAQHPIVGNGFSSPWVSGDPAFASWIVEDGITHAHSMWLDVLLQLGVVGLIVVAVAYFSLLWRSWFFAVDRPRWDLTADRPYSPITLLPILIAVVLLVQGLTASMPIMLWGWMLLVLLSFKLKSVPLVGVGERQPVIERGERSRRVP